MRKDPTEFRERFKKWKETGEYELPRFADGYESFLKTLPKNQRTPGAYNTRRYWELNGKPKDFAEAIGKGMYAVLNDNGVLGWHANSVAYNESNDTYEFMKPNYHPTRWMELVEGYDKSTEFQKDYKVLYNGPMLSDRYVPREKPGLKIKGGQLPRFGGGKEDNDINTASGGVYIGAIPFVLAENNRNTKYNKSIDEQISNKQSYGWNNNARDVLFHNAYWLKKNVNPAWNIIDANALKIPFGVQNMSGATEDDNAFFQRHLGYERDKEHMPVTGIRFAGDYNDNGSLRLPNAEYTGLSKKAKDFIREGIKNKKIEPKKDGSWTQIDEKGTRWGKHTSHLGTYSIRENNGSGIYDIVDTYDFPWYNPILNREEGKQIEVRDTIHGDNARPDYYNFKYSKSKAVPRFATGTESEIDMGPRNNSIDVELVKLTVHEQPVSNVDPVGKFVVESVGATKGAKILGDVFTKLRLNRMADTYRRIRRLDDDVLNYTGKSLRKEHVRFADKAARNLLISRPNNPFYWIMDPIVAGYSKLQSHPVIGPLIPF